MTVQGKQSVVRRDEGEDPTPRPMKSEELVPAAKRIAPLLVEDAEAGEQARSITPRVVRAMQDAGAFRMTMPKALGGIEADPVTQYEVIEALSIADGAAGWVAMIGSDAGYFAGRIPFALAKELFPDPDLLSAGVASPSGTAERVDGGYRVKGRWAFASCCRHAAWFKGLCIVTENGQPVTGPGGRPVTRIMGQQRRTRRYGLASRDLVRSRPTAHGLHRLRHWVFRITLGDRPGAKLSRSASRSRRAK